MVENKQNTCSPKDKQYLFIIRHGDRWDYAHPEWKKLPRSRTGDTPMSTLGHQQAREVGEFLDDWMYERGFTSDDLTWLSSPFLRCLQTSDDALNSFKKVDCGKIQINPEFSIFEWDGHGGEWHKDLPGLEERRHYFPRLNMKYVTNFTPELPEPRHKFFKRCDRAALEFNKRYPFRKGQVFVMISHAAGCIALSSAFAGLQLSDITPAGPCSIYGLERTKETPIWSIAPHDDLNGYNGYTGHLSEMGSSTRTWNNFGEGGTKFYTGPPTSRFAPKEETSNL